MNSIDASLPDEPVVSIGMATYNHEKYIARAIESVLMQEVTFSYELVIAEDCSTDHTREIVQKYQKKYPEVIRLILHEKNIGMQKNSNCLRRACRGKYRANLEGDDYWLFSDKLQKQVNFLEEHPDFIATGGDFVCVNDFGAPCAFPWGKLSDTYCQDDEYTKEHLERWLLPSHISATLFRNVFRNYSEEELQQFEEIQVLGDRRVYMLLVTLGRIRHEKKPVMVRRILTKSSTSFTSAIKKTNWLQINFDWLCEAERFAKKQLHTSLDLSKRKEMYWLGSLRMFYWHPTKVNFDTSYYIFKNSSGKMRCIFIFIRAILKKVSCVLERDGIILTLRKGASVLREYLVSAVKYALQKEDSLQEENQSSIATSFSKK
ncbi:glycosyltransferase family 2 protein [Pyramidobacter sp. YE332]|uniref:glycosyltransferase family 2 protein n=1 Tax=Pyramidobacter sp. YE332 TaxID=3068894 RepID=UPI00294B5F48|nr:glycosyltransferase family 2 protein [Pyramidobacter sp. YE332]WOL38946.1 glycosyltransferase family 2 protein [Pyramidobacter sp. YE332]